MPTVLKDLILDEVSLVDCPANAMAKVLIAKRDTSDVAKQQMVCPECGAKMDFTPEQKKCIKCGAAVEPAKKSTDAGVDKALMSTADQNNLPDSAFAYISPGGKVVDGKTEPCSLRHLPYKNADGSVDPAHCRNALSRLSQTEGIPPAMQDKIKAKLQAALESTKKSDANKAADGVPQKESDMELQEQIDKLTADLAIVTKDRDELKAKVDASENTPEAVEKRKLDAMPAEIRKRLEDAESKVQKMQEAAELQAFTKRAKDAGQADGFGEILYRISKGQAKAEDVAEVERLLKAQAEQIRKGNLFDTLGAGGAGSDDVEQQVIAKCREMMKADKGLTFGDAQAKVFAEDRSLYEAYREAKK
jgi:hypothetical protein